ncbi:threonine-phosphate decarboxylase [Aestuariivita boseongensis]|uniref:threonine-phosphate decarboxylase n=1 Tax=Aestuariivita boseongensis TaxID=1470562 RepID=UPI0006815D84|nr:threonine-phosphate decarboxylase [Aestuariivita boseongensis]
MQPSSPDMPRDHGGNLDAAMARFGGRSGDWLDLSTGINPVPYPVKGLTDTDWTRLPDASAQDALLEAARRFWQVPEGAAILAAPGASALIARLPLLRPAARVQITMPTYNEHAAAFAAAGWEVTDTGPTEARVMVHPNNPDGHLFSVADITGDLTVIDESFCDICPDRSLIAQATRPGMVILKSFGKFWGLAGLRLGFAIGDPEAIAALAQMLGPWPVSGPALRIGTRALVDLTWADATRARLSEDRAWLDRVMTRMGAQPVGGTDLFGLYAVEDAAAMQERLARGHIWTRIFPYSKTLIRLGLPAPDKRAQLETAI